MPKSFITKGEEKVQSVGDLQWPEVAAILETMAQDKHLVLHKLEVRQKQGGYWRVIIRASREAKP